MVIFFCRVFHLLTFCDDSLFLSFITLTAVRTICLPAEATETIILLPLVGTKRFSLLLPTLYFEWNLFAKIEKKHFKKFSDKFH